MKSRKRTHIVRPFQLVEKVRFLFCASCDSTHKIEFAQQIHKNRGRVPRFLYKGRKNVSGGRGFSSAFDRKRGFDREAARKTIVFRQPQTREKQPFPPHFCLVCGAYCVLHALDVLLDVRHAVPAHESGSGRGRNTVLTGAALCDQTGLAHLFASSA